MATQDTSVQKIDQFIQARMQEMGVESVTPVEATHWLIQAGLRDKIESRPGSYLRGLCRKGKITGAEKIERSWLIKKSKRA